MNRGNYLLTAKLTAILRLANAMDRSHYQKVKALNVTLKDRILYLVVDSARDVSLELGLLKDKKEFLSIPEKSIYLSFASSNVKLPSLCTLCLDMKPGILS